MSKKEKEKDQEPADLTDDNVPEENVEEVLAEALRKADSERKRADELTELCQRIQADFDNYRKRNIEQSKKIREDATVDVIIKFLPVLDVLENAASMIKDESVASGLNMVKKQLVAIFEENGVKEIDALNKDFDPNIHNAIMCIDDEANAGKVIEVFQKGYIRGERVIRHSAVKIAK